MPTDSKSSNKHHNYGSLSESSNSENENGNTISNNHLNINGHNECGYIEFSGKDGRTCHTCGGTGRISKAQEDSLLALIPYNDTRLRPRRTKLYVLISVISCLVICGIIVFFLIPRTVSIKQNAVLNSTVLIDQGVPSTTIEFTYQLNVSNANFFDIYVDNITVNTFFNDIKVGGGTRNKAFSVPSRTSIKEYQINVTVSCLFDRSNNLEYVIDLCTNPNRKVHDVFLVLQATQWFSFMGHSEQSTIQSYSYFDCSPTKSSIPK